MGDEVLIDSRLIGFILAGGVATVLNYSVFILLLPLTNMPLLSSAVGYCAGICISFFINRYLVFRSSNKASFLKYTLAYGSALFCQLLLLGLFIRFGLSAQVGNAVAIGIVVLLNFFLVRKIAFN